MGNPFKKFKEKAESFVDSGAKFVGKFPGEFVEDVLGAGEELGEKALPFLGDAGQGFSDGVGDFLEEGWKSLVYGTKELTGANAAEEANDLARLRIDEENRRALEERQRAQDQTAQDRLAASRAASRGRSSSSRSSRTGGSNYSSLGSDEVDFLGL